MARSPIEGHTRWMKEEWSDRRHRSGDLLQPTEEEGVSTGYGGSGGYGGLVGKIGHARSGRRSRRACGGTRFITVAKDLTSSPFSAHTGGCAGLVRVDVVTIFGYSVKPIETNKPRIYATLHKHLANKPKASGP